VKRITAAAIQLEITPYTAEGKAKAHIRPPVIGVAESDIPEPVLEWLRGLLPPGALDDGK
jgi:hypothetical protein